MIKRIILHSLILIVAAVFVLIPTRAESASGGAFSITVTVPLETTSDIIAPGTGQTCSQTPTITGTTTLPNETVEIRGTSAGSEITVATTTSDSAGNFVVEVNPATPLSVGNNTLTPYVNGSPGTGKTPIVSASPTPSQESTITSPAEGEQIKGSWPTISGLGAAGETVTIYAKNPDGTIIQMAQGTVNADGTFSITPSGASNLGTYQIYVVVGETVSGMISIVFVDPYGIVYDSQTNLPVEGAVVTLQRSLDGGLTWNNAVRGTDFDDIDVNPQTTGSDGAYSYLTVNGNFRLLVNRTGYTFPSTIIAMGSPHIGSHGELFIVADAILNIDLPLDFSGSGLLKVSKDANKRQVSIGDIITYTVTIKNEGASDVTGVYLKDELAAGLKYLDGKVLLDGVPIAEPTGSRTKTFSIGTVSASSSKTLKYQVVVGSGVTFGNYENKAWCELSNGRQISNSATETVKVVPDPLFDLGTVIGKVFNDVNENGIQDNGEETIPYVRIVTEEGTVITTDKDGKWHLPGIIPGIHLFRIDESTLPEGSDLTTEKVVIVDITKGILSKVNFGVKIPLDKLKELKEAKGLDLQIIQEKSPPQMRLNVGLYPENLEIIDNALVDKPNFKTFTNYHLFIKKWKLEIFENDTKRLFKKFEGEGLDYENTLIWDGFSDKAELVKAGKTYYYILTVWGDKGKFDITAAREFKVGELKKEEGFKKSVIEIQDKEKEFKDWNELQGQINGLDKQAIIVKGETIRIKAQGRKEKNELKLSLDNRMSLPVSSGEKIDTEIILPKGIHKLKVVQESSEGRPESIYEKQIKVGDDYLFFVVLGDIKAGYTFNKGNIEPVQQDDKFKEGLWAEGKAAYYLKGKIKGKYLITSSLDTNRQRKELFKVIDPKKYYPVYGDASSINYEASDTQGQLYCLIEWDKSKAIWGNYSTDFNEVEYAKFNRALYGGKVYYESVSNTKFGYPRTKLILFDAKAKQLASHNEFVGTGGSLYYLKYRDIIEGTDAVRIEVRDKISGLVLAILNQQNGVDYHLDYSQGRILFWRPVSSIAQSNSIISTYLLDGNPVYVVVDYEYEPKDKYYEGTYGIRAAQSITDYLQLGATYVKEAKTSEDYELKGIDTILHITKDTFIKVEYAESKSEQVGNFISSDGGLSFTQITTAANDSGKAYGLRFQTKLLDKLYLDSYYGYVGRNFSSSDSISQQGTEKYGLGARWDITSNTVFSLRHDIQRLLDSGNSQTQAQIGAQQTKTTTAQITHTKEKLTLTGEYRHQAVDSPLTGIKAQTNRDIDIIAAKANYKVNERLEVSLEHQETVKGDKNRQTTMGIIYKIVKWLKIQLAQTFGAKGTATTFGAHAQSSNGKTEAFIDRTYGSSLDSSGGTSTSLGIKSQLDEKREIFGTYTISDTSLEGRKQVTSFGGAQKLNDKMKLSANRDFTATRDSSTTSNVLGLSGDINDRLSANIAFEKGEVNNLDSSQATRNAGSIGLTYLEKDKLKASGKLELRYDKGSENKQQYLFYNAIEYILNKVATFFININTSATRNTTAKTTEAKFNEITLGAALRPTDWDRLNLITKYTYFENKQPQGQDSFTNITHEKASVFALEGIYDLTDKLQAVGKLALKVGKEKVSGFDFTESSTWLWINRLNYRFDEYWGLSGEYRILNQRQADDRNQGFLIEVNRNIGDFVQVGVGYNFTKFSDDLVHGNNYSAYGPYFRVTAKFYDRTPEEVARINKKRQEQRKKLELRRQTKEKSYLQQVPTEERFEKDKKEEQESQKRLEAEQKEKEHRIREEKAAEEKRIKEQAKSKYKKALEKFRELRDGFYSGYKNIQSYIQRIFDKMKRLKE